MQNDVNAKKSDRRNLVRPTALNVCTVPTACTPLLVEQRRQEQERLQKIEEENARTQRLKDQRTGLVQARRDNSLNALLRKHKIQEHVEQMRISKRWDKLHEITRILEEDPRGASKKRGMRGSASLPNLESP